MKRTSVNIAEGKKGFSDVGNSYWSSTTFTLGTGMAWYADFGSGYVYTSFEDGELIVWPLRGGQQNNSDPNTTTLSLS